MPLMASHAMRTARFVRQILLPSLGRVRMLLSCMTGCVCGPLTATLAYTFVVAARGGVLVELNDTTIRTLVSALAQCHCCTASC